MYVFSSSAFPLNGVAQNSENNAYSANTKLLLPLQKPVGFSVFPVHLRSLAYPRRWRKTCQSCAAMRQNPPALQNGRGSMIAINCTAVENEVADNMYQRSELDYLIYNDPLAYADLVLNGNPEAYLKSVTEYKPLD